MERQRGTAGTLVSAPSSAQVLGDMAKCRSSAPDQAGDSAATSLNVFLNETFAGSPGAQRGTGKGTVDAGDSVGVGDGQDVTGGGGGFMLSEIDAPLRHLIKAKERELQEIHDFRIRCYALKYSLKDNYAVGFPFLNQIDDGTFLAALRILQVGRYRYIVSAVLFVHRTN